MIHKITDTTGLTDVYFEDIDATVGTKSECYMINRWYFYYFSTIEAAQEKATKLGISTSLAA